MRKTIPPFPRLSGRLFFFPALLPLAELAPWLLSVIGAVVGIAGLSPVTLWRRHRRKILVGASICFAAAGLIVLHAMPAKTVREEGTQLLPQQGLPVPKIISSVKPAAPGALQNFDLLWSKRTEKQILSTPVISGNMLFFGSYQGSVEAISAKNGAPLWSLPLPAPVFSLAPVENGILYAGTGLHQNQSALMLAIDAASGKALWEREFLGHIENPPAVGDGHLWLGAGPGGIWAVDTRDGAILWHGALGHIDSIPLYFNDSIYVPAQPDGAKQQSLLFALDAANGKIHWQAGLPGMPWGSPLIDKTGEMILTTSGIGQIGINKETDRGWAQAFDAANGKMLWQKQLPGMPIQPDVYLPARDLIIYTVKTGELIALDTRSGNIVWQAKVGTEFQSGAILLQGKGEALIAATTFDGIFTIRRAVTGEEVARRIVEKSATASPLSDGDIVYVSTAYAVSAFGGVSSLRSR
jgi:outer membrane protein assembly factor BamB